jgi:hypothetical protein
VPLPALRFDDTHHRLVTFCRAKRRPSSECGDCGDCGVDYLLDLVGASAGRANCSDDVACLVSERKAAGDEPELLSGRIAKREQWSPGRIAPVSPPVGLLKNTEVLASVHPYA